MASQGKRMIPEYLIKYLEGLYNSGIDPTGFQPKLTAGDGIAIDEDNEITYDSETAAPLMENIVDSKGNKRFIDGDGTPSEITGITPKYCKWSLSGTHLMLVYAFDIADTTALTNSQTLVSFALPDYIMDKIFGTISPTIIIRTSVTVISSSLANQSIALAVSKGTTSVSIVNLGNFTCTADRSGRIQIDLLIDNE